MKYAGFFVRVRARLNDSLVTAPLIVLGMWSLAHSRSAALLVIFPFFLCIPLYYIYFIGRWGQTIGDRVLGIRVVNIDGAKATYRQAIYRESVSLSISLVQNAVFFIALLSVSAAAFNSAPDLQEKMKLLEGHMLIPDALFNLIATIWGLGDFIVLLLNEKRRAIHDFIAGTVVIHVEKLETSKDLAGDLQVEKANP